MIQKMKWEKLITNLRSEETTVHFLDEATTIATSVDTKYQTLLGVSSPISTSLVRLITEVKKFFRLETENPANLWKGMPIYISSYKANDGRCLPLLEYKLIEYLGFYEKILTDNGLVRRMVYSKEYENHGGSNTHQQGNLRKSGTNTKTYGEGSSATTHAYGDGDAINRKVRSETPAYTGLYNADEPTADSLFDQAIANYASELNKDKGHNEYDDNEASSARRDGSESYQLGERHDDARDIQNTINNDGNSETVVSGATWEEAKKNINMLFYNELKDYITSLPERVYHYYALDTVPFTELTINYFKYLDTLREMLIDE